MGYDAGSIDAKLTIDQEAFDEGLRMAQDKVKEFEDNGSSVDLDLHLRDDDVNNEITEIQRRLSELSDDGGFSLKVNTDDAREEVDALRDRLDELRNKDVEVKVKTEGIPEAEAKLDELGKSADKAAGEGSGGGGEGGGVGGLIAKFTLLGTLGGGLLDPLVGEIAGLAGAFGVAGAGLGAFGVVAKSDFTQMQTDTKAVTAAQDALTKATTNPEREKAIVALAAANAKLVGPEGQAALAMEKLTTNFSALKAATAGPVFGTMTAGMNVISSILPKLQPIINATATSLSGIFTKVGAAVDGPGFQKFVNFITTQIPTVLGSLSKTMGNFGSGLASMFEGSAGPMGVFLGQLEKLSGGFANLTGSPAFTAFMKQLAGEMQDLTPVIGSLFGLIGHLLTALQPAVAPLTDVLTILIGALTQLASPLGNFIADIAKMLDTVAKSGVLNVLAGVLGDILNALAPLLPVIASLVTTALMPMLDIASQLVNALAPLIAQLAQGLQPVMAPLAEALGIVVTALGKFLIAVGPSLQKVMAALLPILPALAKALIPIATGFAQFATAMAPVITVIAGALVPVINLLMPVIKPLLPLIIAFYSPLAAAALAFHGLVIVFDALAPIVQTVWTWLSNLGSLIAGGLTDAVTWLVGIGKDIVTGLWTGIQDAWKAVTTFFTTMNKTVLGWLSTAASWLIGIGGDVIHGLYTGVTTAWSTVTGWLKNMGNLIIGALGSAVTWLVGIGKNIIQGLLNGVTNAAEAVWTYFKEFASTVVAAIGNVGDALVDVGKGLIMGVWHGFNGLYDWIWDHIKGFFGGILDKVKGFLGISSPSKMFSSEVGMPIAWGVADGITKNQHLAVNAMKGLFTAVKGVDPGTALGQLPGYGGGYLVTGNASGMTGVQAVQMKNQTDLLQEIKSLHNTIKAAPKETGKVLATNIGSEFTKTVRAQDQLALTRGRRNGVGG